MNFAGISIEEDLLRVAFIRKKGKKIEIEHLLCLHTQETQVLESVHKKIAKEKWLVISGLKFSSVIRRNFFTKLHKPKDLKEILPFQAESLVPFPEKETLLAPIFFSEKEGTDVVFFASQEKALQSHLEELARFSLYPDKVSCYPQAICRFLNFMFPPSSTLSLSYGPYCIVVKDKKVEASHLVGEKEELKELFLKTKYPDAKKVDFSEAENSSSFSWEELQNFLIPIGLALDAALEDFTSVQFLGTQHQPLRLQKKRQRQISLLLSTALFSILLTTAGLQTHRLLQHKKWHAQIDTALELQQKELSLPLKEKKDLLMQKIKEKSFYFSLNPTLPSAEELWKWAQEAAVYPVEIVNFDYLLVQKPTEEKRFLPYEARVTIEFISKELHPAEAFRQKAAKIPHAECKEEKWKQENDRFFLTLTLKEKA